MNAIDMALNECKRRKITFAKLAIDSNVGEKTLYRMFHGHDVKYSSVQKVLDALGISVSYNVSHAQKDTLLQTPVIKKGTSKVPSSYYLRKINYNIEKKVTMTIFLKAIKAARPSWIINKLFNEYDLATLSELVRNTKIDYRDLSKAYSVSSYRSSKLDRFFATTDKVLGNF